MNSAVGDGKEQKSRNGWLEGETAPPSHQASPENHEVPAGFTREFRVLSEVCNSMSSGFLLLNQQRHITYSNQSALRLLHIHQQKFSGDQPFDLLQHLVSLAADPQAIQSDLQCLWSPSEQDYTVEFALRDALRQWLRVHTFPVHSDQGKSLGLGVLLEDTTLEHATLEAQGEALARAAHKLKTPLAIIKGCATTLLGSLARWDPTMQREMLQMIDMQSDSLYDILNTLLDVWRFETGAQSLHLAQSYLPELLEQLVRRWAKNTADHRFVLDTPSDVTPVLCDVMRIEQVLNHLLNNAVTYSPAGSPIKIHLKADEDEVRISVADEGVGIAAKHLDRIFDRFYRVETGEEEVSSSGLGLAAARATVEAHGGKIWADSSGPGKGTTFYFTLPYIASSPASLHSDVPSALAEPVSLKHQRLEKKALFRHKQRMSVLLAESDARLTRYLRANLEEQHYRVQTVSHGVQCLRQIDLEEPDIIILSTRLTDMSGVELLQRLREFSQAPVIMLCDECDEDERVHLFDMGSDDLVIKPFGIKELLARIRALLRRHTVAEPGSRQHSIFANGDLTIDYAQHLVTVRGKQVQLSRTEYKLLSLLAQNAGIVVTHELLLEKVWGPEYHRDVDFIWVYISRLRRKIEEDSRHPKYIVTVPDVGYKLAKL